MGFGVAMTFIWGIQDGACQCLVSCILGFQFDSKTTPFSVFKSVQSFSIFAVILGEAHLKTRQAYIWFFIAFAVYTVAAYSILIGLFTFRTKPKADESEVLQAETESDLN